METIKSGQPLVLTLSGGKDSTTTTLLGLEAIRRAKELGVAQAKHHVSSSSTGIENPAMENHLLDLHTEIEAYCARHSLPVEVNLVQPSLASQFVVTVIGRGTLPRFPENGANRTCSQDWKSRPQERLARQLREESLGRGFRETVTVLGTRFDESAQRAARMKARGEQAQRPVRNDNGHLTLSPCTATATKGPAACSSPTVPRRRAAVASVAPSAPSLASAIAAWKRCCVRRSTATSPV
ncbi:MAG: hypothetical protein ACOZCP_19275 [Pseudomonadota bacterium]